MDTNDKLISVIIPNYNNENYIKKAIESVLCQTYRNVEVIVVDDCSTDRSVEIVEGIKNVDNRVKIVCNKKNQGVSKNRHIGIEFATGEFISTLDSDDVYISKKKIEKEYELLKMGGLRLNCIAFSGIQLIDKDGKEMGGVNYQKKVVQGEIYQDLITRNCLIPRDFLFSKKMYYEVGGFDTEIPIYEDWDLKIRLSKQCNFVYTNMPGIGYRQLNTGLSSVKKETHLKWMNYVFDKNVEKDKTSYREVLTKNIEPGIFIRFKRKLTKLLYRTRNYINL